MSITFPRLASKVVCITGASSGIGKAAALLYAKSGANLVLIARRADKLDELAKEIKASNNVKVASIPMDVTDRKAVDNLLETIPSELRAVDILVNNAGGAMGTAHVGDTLQSDIDFMVDVNVKSVMHLTQIFVKHFKEQRKGHFVMIGSVAGRDAYPGGSVYNRILAALLKPHCVPLPLLYALKELYNTPIRVTEIQPGLVETEFSVVRFKGDKSKADKVYEGMTPLVAEDIAEEIVWATSRPAHVNLCEVFVMPVNQGGPQLVHRESK